MTPSLRITDKSRPQPTSYLPYVDTKFLEPTTVQEDRFLDLYKVMHVLILGVTGRGEDPPPEFSLLMWPKTA